MSTAQAFCPDWASSPGETIADILRERRIKVETFADLIGQSVEQVQRLLSGESPITLGVARQLQQTLGASVEFWMARDFRYRQIADPEEATNAWVQELPIRDMVKFGWIEKAPNGPEQLTACLKFFNVPSVAAWHRVYGTLERMYLFKKSASFESRQAAVAAWLRQGEIQAEGIECSPWEARGFENRLERLRLLTRESRPEIFWPELQKTCADVGIAATIVPTPNGCPASGATRFLTDKKALLLLSFRYLVEDQFWFSFFHEAGHLLLHSHKETFIEGIETSDTRAENEANEFAANVLIPPQHRMELLNLNQRRFELARFARRMGISTGIVVGQLQHYKRIPNAHFNTLKRRYHWS